MTAAARRRKSSAGGIGQLTLVEHALCPLAPPSGPFSYETTFCHFENRRRELAKVTIHCPLGLKPSDEFYLWGLLALTLGQREPSPEFLASPYYCLKELGIGWGGKQLRLFDEACCRLAAVHYGCSNFWDPVRKERVKAEFGFLERIRPLKTDSHRAWRFMWSPVFFELTKATGGYLRFDLEMYRGLDAASRRLFLLTSKQLHKAKVTQWFDLRELAVNQLGFSGRLETRYLKRKVQAASSKLAARGFLASVNEKSGVQRVDGGKVRVQFRRGPAFESASTGAARSLSIERQAEYSQLLRIGLEKRTTLWVLREFPSHHVREWCEITIAAMERGREFRSSPAAFFMHYLKEATAGTATAPDWWHAARNEEHLREAAEGRRQAAVRENLGHREENRLFAEYLKNEGRKDMEALAKAFVDQSGPQAAVRRRVAEETRIQLLPKFRQLRRTSQS
ncbi:MAG: hypothetical protein GY878_26945 [Fuerstiella sp.]|nr:hypothetical protein [Fuerstiella sp.]